MIKVAKFGGSSLADAGQFNKVKALIEADSSRRFVVVSAPGKRFPSDEKVTDLLYSIHRAYVEQKDWLSPLQAVRERFLSIEQALALPPITHAVIEEVAERLQQGASASYMASRGEYLSARLLSAYLGLPFIDAADCVRFQEQGGFCEDATKEACKLLLQRGQGVIPGFYGSDKKGEIVTFDRGGSDISGAIVAKAVQAEVYENWTDVDGILMADPRIVSSPRIIDTVSYGELRELSYMGASVLHQDAIYPVQQARIPIHVRNTNKPELPGTWIVNDGDLLHAKRTGPVTGIAGKRGFTVITLNKDNLHKRIGFAAGLLNILLRYGIAVESMPSGIDNMSVILHDSDIKGKMDAVYHDIREELQPDTLEIASCIALIATVGKGMARNVGVASKLTEAVARAGVNIRLIDQGPSEMNIIVGVEQRDFETACRAIYEAFA